MKYCHECGMPLMLQPWGGYHGVLVCENLDCPQCHPRVMFESLRTQLVEHQARIKELQGVMEQVLPTVTLAAKEVKA